MIKSDINKHIPALSVEYIFQSIAICLNLSNIVIDIVQKFNRIMQKQAKGGKNNNACVVDHDFKLK